jgi:hypothetical protein
MHYGDSLVCECDVWLRSACVRETFYKEHDGKRYCVLHYPGIEKKEEFQKALEWKLSQGDFDFSGVWFPEAVSFKKLTFSAAADFGCAKFSANANFDGAQFSADATFDSAEFNESAFFGEVQFGAEANFNLAQFNSAFFGGAVFNGTATFQRTNFIEKVGSPGRSVNSNNKAISINDKGGEKTRTLVYFDRVRFKDGVSFEKNMFAGHAQLSFDAAVFEKPERVTFHTVALRPHWFFNVDSRKLNFINVDWGELHRWDAVSKEIKALESKYIANTPRLMAITFRQLAVNAEENNRYEEAANFRYMAMDARRIERGFIENLFSLGWWYWALSGYGERVWRAFVALLVIWLLFAVFYWSGNATWWQPKQASKVAAESNAGEKQPSAVAQPLTIPDALIYSLGVMALQKPEPLPANKRAKGLVLLETILGPFQAALLALAIRRKFMR